MGDLVELSTVLEHELAIAKLVVLDDQGGQARLAALSIARVRKRKLR